MLAKRLLTAVLTLVLLVGVSCTGNEVDDADAADVVLQVVSFLNPVVTAELDAGGGGGCVFTVTEWSVSLAATPVNSLAGSPFSDVAMNSLDIVYTWDSPGLSTPDRTIGLGGIVVPAGAISALTFFPIGFTDLTNAFLGESAGVTLTFHGRTVEGTAISLVLANQLLVESCS